MEQESQNNIYIGGIHKPRSHQGGGGLKMSQNWLRHRCKSVYVRGGPKSPKKWLHGL